MTWTNNGTSSPAGSGGPIKFSQGAVLTPAAGIITPTDSFHHVAAGAITSIATSGFDTSVGNLLILQADGAVTFTASSSLVVRQAALATNDVMLLILDGTNWVDVTPRNITQSADSIALTISNTGDGSYGIVATSTGLNGVGVFGGSSSGPSVIALSASASNTTPTVIARDAGQAANTKMLDIQTSGAASVASIDKEGDAILNTAIVSANAVTAGTMTVTNSARLQSSLHRFDWTNAMVTALGASTTGDIAVCTLPAKTRVKNVYVVIKTADTSANALTVAVGRTGAAYIDYIVASDAKAAANTVYGDVVGERGANLTGYDLPSYTSTTVVNAHFIKTTSNLSTVLTSTGTIFIETELLP